MKMCREPFTGKNRILVEDIYYGAVIEININVLNKTEREIKREINKTKGLIKNKEVKLKVNFIKDEKNN